MKYLLACLLVLFTSLPAGSREQKPYLAVFSSNDFPPYDWKPFHPDLIVKADDWRDFEPFLRRIRQEAKGRPIIIDLQVHGSPVTGRLGIAHEYPGGVITYRSNWGYVLTEIEEEIGTDKLIILCESCYGEYTFETTLRTYDKRWEGQRGELYGIYTKKVRIPIYSIGDTVNYNNTVFLQYHYKVRLHFIDLRDYQDKPPCKPNSSVASKKEIEFIWDSLRNY